MPLKDDLQNRVSQISREIWNVTPGRSVPDVDALAFANAGKTFDACFLYADLRDSTGLVQRVSQTRAAEYYKAFLHCASKLIQQEGGTIEAYDGDRVMGIYLGIDKEASAVRTAFKIRAAMRDIVDPTFASMYQDHQPLKYTVGVDAGPVLTCKAGVRGDSQLVWLGLAANRAAKLNSFPELDERFQTRITAPVFRALPQDLKFSITDAPLWRGPSTETGPSHYRSDGWMEID